MPTTTRPIIKLTSAGCGAIHVTSTNKPPHWPITLCLFFQSLFLNVRPPRYRLRWRLLFQPLIKSRGFRFGRKTTPKARLFRMGGALVLHRRRTGQDITQVHGAGMRAVTRWNRFRYLERRLSVLGGPRPCQNQLPVHQSCSLRPRGRPRSSFGRRSSTEHPPRPLTIQTAIPTHDARRRKPTSGFRRKVIRLGKPTARGRKAAGELMAPAPRLDVRKHRWGNSSPLPDQFLLSIWNTRPISQSPFYSHTSIGNLQDKGSCYFFPSVV